MSQIVQHASVPAFHILLIAPPQYIHSLAYAELIDSLAAGLQTLGYEPSFGVNEPRQGAINIVLGGQLLHPNLLPLLPPDSIIYNSEQVEAGSEWMASALPALVARFHTWDYSRRNIDGWLRMIPDARLTLVPIGYAPGLTRIEPAMDQDIDVLFYGSASPRRLKVLNELARRGVRVHVEAACYGSTRDALIARSRLVLNIHTMGTQIFEIVRVSYLLANAKAVVAEVNAATEINPVYRQAVMCARYAGLVDACIALLEDDRQRRSLEHRGFQIMQNVTAAECLRGPIQELVNQYTKGS